MTNRRQFLAGLAGAGALLALRPALGLPNQGPTRPLGIAVIGLGNFARFALPRIQASLRCRVAALVTGQRAKGERWAAEQGLPPSQVYGYDEYARLADDASVDLAYLTLPVGLHAEHAVRAMQAGKHVLSEKTLAATSAEAEHMLRVAAESRRHLLIAYRTCFGPAYARVSELIAGGALGGVRHLDVHKGFRITLPPNDWRFDPALAGGGSLVDVGVYSIQAARMFAGGMPVSVTAQAWSDPRDARFARVAERVAFTLEFPDGVLASGSSSWSYGLQNRLRVGLEQGWLDLDPASPVTGQVLRIGREGPRRVEEHALSTEDQLPLMFDHCAEVVLDGAPSRIPASDGLADLRIIEAIHRAAASGRAERV